MKFYLVLSSFLFLSSAVTPFAQADSMKQITKSSYGYELDTACVDAEWLARYAADQDCKSDPMSLLSVFRSKGRSLVFVQNLRNYLCTFTAEYTCR